MFILEYAVMLVAAVALLARWLAKKKRVRKLEHVVVCGGAGAIGQAICRLLRQSGCRVTVVDRQCPRASIGKESDTEYVQCDLSDPEECRRAFLQIGRAEALVNCCGIAKGRRFLDKTAEDWEQSWRCNVLACVHACREFLSWSLTLMEPQETRAVVVNVSSVLALAGVPGMADYCATKAALNALTEALRLEHPTVAIWTICPFLIKDSPMFPSSGSKKSETNAWSIRIKWPWLTRPLTCEQVALRIIDCMLDDDARGGNVIMPAFFKLTYAARLFLPTAWLDYCQHLLGSTSSVVFSKNERK
jgi:NAD(P)-dependent dehydrogenase (short-subunit alcohol dehydrogenase family)